MAKLKLLKTRNKRIAVLDAKGEPVLDQFGRPKTSEKKVPIYLFVSMTDEERELYRKAQTQNDDGNDYYREIDGKPAYFTNRWLGIDVEAELVTLDDGTIVVSPNTTDVDILEMEKEANPEMAAVLSQRISNQRLAGTRYQIKGKVEEDPEEEEDENPGNRQAAPQNVGAGAGAGEENDDEKL